MVGRSQNSSFLAAEQLGVENELATRLSPESATHQMLGLLTVLAFTALFARLFQSRRARISGSSIAAGRHADATAAGARRALIGLRTRRARVLVRDALLLTAIRAPMAVAGAVTHAADSHIVLHTLDQRLRRVAALEIVGRHDQAHVRRKVPVLAADSPRYKQRRASTG